MLNHKNNSYTCPYCEHKMFITNSNQSHGEVGCDISSKYGARVVVFTQITVCPNIDCRELIISSILSSAIYNIVHKKYNYTKIENWDLRPQGKYKNFPEYIPKPILDDYKEACLILKLSPKASATLLRRCLQGMIRDFWKIQDNRLVDEINKLKGLIDSLDWEAITAVRKIGNIAAHMEKDINLIIDVTEDEAIAMKTLIEMLLNDWYVVKHERQKQLEHVIAISEKKDTEKKQNT